MANHKDDWECPADVIRRHEETMIETKAKLEAFMNRYDNDRRECTERNRSEHQMSLEWRDSVDKKLDDISGFLSEFKPNYRRIMVFAGVFVVGALATIFKMIWEHVSQR